MPRIIDWGKQVFDLQPELLKPGVAVVGRSFLKSKDPKISGYHAAIIEDADGLYIVDLSMNGSWYKEGEKLRQIYNVVTESKTETPNMIMQDNAKTLGKGIDAEELKKYKEKSLATREKILKIPSSRPDFTARGTKLQDGMQLFFGQKDPNKAYIYSQG